MYIVAVLICHDRAVRESKPAGTGIVLAKCAAGKEVSNEN